MIAGRLAGGLAALILAAPLLALEPAAQPGGEPASLLVMRFSPDAQAGHVGKGAGLACLPNGKLRLRDFAPSPLLARDVLAAALGEGDSGRMPQVAVTLQGLDGKLCARDYGVFGRGDRQGLSGAVTFRYAWTRGGVPLHEEVIRVEAGRREAGTPSDLFSRGLDQLARRIRESS